MPVRTIADAVSGRITKVAIVDDQPACLRDVCDRRVAIAMLQGDARSDELVDHCLYQPIHATPHVSIRPPRPWRLMRSAKVPPALPRGPGGGTGDNSAGVGRRGPATAVGR